ncbi:hypothetical protein OS190_13360 [Sulfitobacter sp. F26204]|uniref:hypothetical protein n=1 Tax=Sulfitobacter sp. F26204 TaxID=2996014 RepID=UPI00225E09E4|nr:hypothetical protein [Sulfitobacter sp. F26204]MCX7560559.1 hypothetical protein [Sulfitobacter sp. F26204]
MKKFMKFLTLCVCVLLCSRTLSYAQDVSSGEFCALSPLQMLTQLDGTWTLKQGAGGAATYRGIGVPLPPQKPIGLKLTYNEKSGFVEMLSASGDNRAVLFPSENSDNNWAAEMIQKFPESAPENAGCTWSEMPVFIGTNVYDLSGHSGGGVHTLETIKDGLFDGPLSYSECKNVVEIGGRKAARPEHQPFFDAEFKKCESLVGQLTPGTMVMTIFARFLNADTASGTVTFEGEQGGYWFAAAAPLKFSRN